MLRTDDDEICVYGGTSADSRVDGYLYQEAEAVKVTDSGLACRDGTLSGRALAIQCHIRLSVRLGLEYHDRMHRTALHCTVLYCKA